MLAIGFLQLRNPPILPSLHRLYTESNSRNECIINGVDCSFFDTPRDLFKYFSIENTESLGSLLFGFFRYYALEFDYEHDVVSVRSGGLLSKVDKHWNHNFEHVRNYLAVEEPFNVTRNLGGLYCFG